MTQPLNIPDGISINEVPVTDANLGPDLSYKDIAPTLPVPESEVNDSVPRAWSEGGIIESVKRAIVKGVRDALQGSTLHMSAEENLKFNVSIEYPLEEDKYPGVWVQFAIEDLVRSGLGEDYHEKDANGNWVSIRQWMFDGRITLVTAALSAKDCDRLSDAVIAQLAFSRAPDQVIRNPRVDNRQMRGLWTELMNNPYVSMTLGTDRIESGGLTVTNGVPWAQNIMLYENNFSIKCHGQFNIAFRYDGVYELRAINVSAGFMQTDVSYVETPSGFVVPPNQRGHSH